MRKKMQLLTRYHVLIILVAVVVLFSVLVKGFFSVSTLTNVLWSTSLVGIIAAGAIYPIITGGIDLSVGSVVGLSTVMMASLMSDAGASFPVALLTTLLLGALIGLFNGILTIKLKLPAFVATLASVRRQDDCNFQSADFYSNCNLQDIRYCISRLFNAIDYAGKLLVAVEAFVWQKNSGLRRKCNGKPSVMH